MILAGSVAGTAFSAFAAGEDGIRFSADEMYRTAEALASFPHTWEAWIKVDKNASSGRLGVIAGNYGGSTASANFEIREKGNPYIYWHDSGSGVGTANFSNVDVRTGEWIHLAITVSDHTVVCYVNGAQAQTLNLTLPAQDDQNMGVLCLGGDLRSGNVQYLKSTAVRSVAVFSTVRTASEIAEDAEEIDLSADGLMGAWDLTKSGRERLTDQSGNQNHLDYLNASDPTKNEYVTSPEEMPQGGMNFTGPALYRMNDSLDEAPLTYEATLWFPKTMDPSTRGGVIIGNYPKIPPYISFEIYSNGSPRLYLVDSASKTHNYIFNKVSVYNGKRTHIAITVDEKNQLVNCYVDGALRQSLPFEEGSGSVSTRAKLALGGDYRADNACWFKGRLFDAALYGDVRTATEIQADMETPDSDGLLLRYDMRGTADPDSEPEQIADLSGHGFDAVCTHPVTWMDSHSLAEDYAYSFVFLGDTQVMNELYPDGFVGIYDWILDHAEEKKIAYVMGLGDITNRDLDEEWERARTQFGRLEEAGIDFSLVRGNHDSSAKFNRTFSQEEYRWSFDGDYDGKLENTWRIVTVGKIKYLLFTLDYGPSDAVLEWVGEVIEDHPDCQVILTTHCYLFRDGTTLDQNDVCPPATTGGYNNGDDMWEKLVSRYENIVLVVNGHDPSDEVVLAQTEGENGNIVSQLLIDPQGTDASLKGTGMVTILYFSADGRRVQVETYSTVFEKYYMDTNQFTFELDVNGSKPNETETETQTDSGRTESDTETVSDPGETEGDTAKEEPVSKTGCGAIVSLNAVWVSIPLALSVVWRKKAVKQNAKKINFKF